MFYSHNETCPLPHDPLKAIVSPRPIGWISTLDANGIANLAPYSFFNAVSSSPGVLMFSSEGMKDSATNAKTSGEFVFSLATFELRNAMNASSQPVDSAVDEYELADLAKATCVHVAAPRVAASPASLECKTLSTQSLTDLDGKPLDVHLVFGQIVGVHIADDCLTPDGRFDTAGAQPLARCGYDEYSAVTSMLKLQRPGG